MASSVNDLGTFQLTTSQGGRRMEREESAYRTCSFNSRPHKEVDVPYMPHRDGIFVFQLTTSQGGRQRCSYWN